MAKGLEELIYCNGFKGSGKQQEFVMMWRKMQASTDAEERSLMIRSLGCSDDREVLRDFLQTSIATNSDARYSRKERLEVFESVLRSTVGVPAAIEFLENHEADGISQL